MEASNKLKEQGNQLVKSQNYSKAISLYKEAINCDKLNPALYSNISLCYYELGQNELSLEFALKAIEYSEAENSYNPNLLIKNLIRQSYIEFYKKNFSKVKEIIVRMDSMISNYNTEEEPFASFKKEKTKINDLLLADEQVRSDNNVLIQSKLYEILPKYRCHVETEVYEFYSVGHDKAMSAVNASLETEDENIEKPFDETKIDQSELNKILKIDVNKLLEMKGELDFSCLFGGVGDARHLYTTLIDIHNQIKDSISLRPELKEKVKIHLALNDIHPCSLAKIIIAVYLLKRLNCLLHSQEEKNDKQDLIYETFHYAYLGAVVPEYIHNHLLSILDEICALEFSDLKTELSSIDIDEATWADIKKVLFQWKDEDCPASTQTILQHYQVKSDPISDLSALSEYPNDLCKNIERLKQERIEKEKEEIKGFVNNMSDEQVNEMCAKLGASIQNKREFLMHSFLEITSNEEYDTVRNSNLSGCVNDTLVAEKYKVLLPCGKKSSEDKLQCLISAGSNMDSKAEKKNESLIRKYINDSMKPNFTMLHYDWLEKYGHQILSFHPVEFVGHLYANNILKQPEQAQTLFCYTSNFFKNLAQAFKLFSDLPNCKFEILLGDVNTKCQEIIATKAERSSKGLVTEYDRIFVSNIPDYTGMIPYFIYILPVLKKSKTSFINSNVLLAPGLYKDEKEYVYTSTLLNINKNEVEKVFKACLISGGLWGETRWQHKLDGTQEKLTKDEFSLWLGKVFFYVVLPAKRESRNPIRENYPLNLKVFFDLCENLVKIYDYPANWVSNFLENLLQNKFITKARPAYKSPNPIGSCDFCPMEKIDIGPFLLELRTLYSLSFIRSGYPLLNNVSVSSDVSKYKLKCIDFDTLIAEKTGFSKSSVLGLAFVLDTKTQTSDLRYRLLNYTQKGEKIEVHVFSVLEFNSDKGVVYLYLSESEMEKLNKEDYKAFIIRTDSWDKLCSCSKIQKIDNP